jgi:hypothetical protein
MLCAMRLAQQKWRLKIKKCNIGDFTATNLGMVTPRIWCHMATQWHTPQLAIYGLQYPQNWDGPSHSYFNLTGASACIAPWSYLGCLICLGSGPWSAYQILAGLAVGWINMYIHIYTHYIWVVSCNSPSRYLLMIARCHYLLSYSCWPAISHWVVGYLSNLPGECWPYSHRIPFYSVIYPAIGVSFPPKNIHFVV